MNQDFIGSEYRDVKKYWDGGPDNSRDFNKNRIKYQYDWYYFDKKISYKYNKHGFRERDFDKVDWENSIVIFGCSNVLGIGLSIEDNLASLVNNYTGIPTVNLGTSSPLFFISNKFLLADFLMWCQNSSIEIFI